MNSKIIYNCPTVSKTIFLKWITARYQPTTNKMDKISPRAIFWLRLLKDGKDRNAVSFFVSPLTQNTCTPTDNEPQSCSITQ